MRTIWYVFVFAAVFAFAEIAMSDVFSDYFEDGSIDTNLWVVGGGSRAGNESPIGSGSWYYSHQEVVDTDGYLNARVWGPEAGRTRGAEAWVMTTYNFNDGEEYLFNFSWEPAFDDPHFNIYFLQITDGFIPPIGDIHWPTRNPEDTAYPDELAETTNLLWNEQPDGNWYRGWWHFRGLPSPGRQDQSITIDSSGTVKLYSEPDASGCLIWESTLNGSAPWHIRFMVTDATSSGFPAGDARLKLYNFSAICTSNEPPVAICKTVTVEAGPGCVADASIDNGSYDPDGDLITITQKPPGPYPLGDTLVTLTVTDDSDASDSCTAIVTVVDTTPPVITLIGDETIILECSVDVYEEQGAIALDICDPEVSLEIGGDTVDTSTCGTYIVTYDATDDSSNDAIQVTRTVTVEDTVPPEIITAIVEPQVVEVGQTVNYDAVVADECGFTIEWDFGDGSPSSTENPTTHTYDSADIYTVTLTATDCSDEIATEEFFVVVYDPSTGFVTGGGWIWSPAGALTDNPDLEGKANFGFVSKYKKGATEPTGQTEFVFQADNLNFHSSSYDWLVVTGSDYARFKGTGTINGSGEYKFMLWAGDDDPDTFRIKIWWEEGEIENVVYDNGMDQAIGGGSIKIHTNQSLQILIGEFIGL